MSVASEWYTFACVFSVGNELVYIYLPTYYKPRYENILNELNTCLLVGRITSLAL